MNNNSWPLLDDGVEFVSSSGATSHSAGGRSTSFAPLASLAPMDRATWTVVVRGTKASDTRSSVKLQSHETTRPVEETESTRFYK
jgi:hypothetical protein